MAAVAERVPTAAAFDDLVLPAATLALLHDFLAWRRHGRAVLEDWGLGRAFGREPGATALFAGPSGTGKTMAAGVVAAELGLPLYRVDLAGTVSKYIGETEKNLERIFTAAARAEVVLFFDEADALFGKRSEVADSHDRYANIEISYLLQRMERHAGLTILATNLSQNLDEAFLRRLDTVVEFAPPRAADRERLWRRLATTRAPLAADVDFALLAKGFELTGGSIRNAALAAAHLAAAEGEPIAMRHLMRAVARELAKLGKPVRKADFGGFAPELRAGAG
jgi:SpoVK/Ycf46/Vps4 family AAA+-type ATPase